MRHPKRWRRPSAASSGETGRLPARNTRLVEIADYIHERNPTAARRVQQGIRDALAKYPSAGRAVEADIRRFVVPRLPYLIY